MSPIGLLAISYSNPSRRIGICFGLSGWQIYDLQRYNFSDRGLEESHGQRILASSVLEPLRKPRIDIRKTDLKGVCASIVVDLAPISNLIGKG